MKQHFLMIKDNDKYSQLR